MLGVIGKLESKKPHKTKINRNSRRLQKKRKKENCKRKSERNRANYKILAQRNGIKWYRVEVERRKNCRMNDAKRTWQRTKVEGIRSRRNNETRRRLVIE